MAVCFVTGSWMLGESLEQLTRLVGTQSVVVTSLVYSGVAVFALIIGHVVFTAAGELTSRMLSSTIGLTGFLFAVDSTGSELIAPAVAVAVMLTLHSIGEVLFRRIRVKKNENHDDNDSDPHHPVPVPV